MYGLLYVGDNERVFEVFKTYGDAYRRAREIIHIGGVDVTVFEYDDGMDMFVEYFTIGR